MRTFEIFGRVAAMILTKDGNNYTTFPTKQSNKLIRYRNYAKGREEKEKIEDITASPQRTLQPCLKQGSALPLARVAASHLYPLSVVASHSLKPKFARLLKRHLLSTILVLQDSQPYIPLRGRSSWRNPKVEKKIGEVGVRDGTLMPAVGGEVQGQGARI